MSEMQTPVTETLIPIADSEPAEVVEPTAPTEAEPTPEPKFKVNYGKEEREVSYEEAKELIERGLNYEPVKEKWEASKQTLSKIETIARKAGFTNADGHGDIEAYYAAAEEQLKRYEIEQMTKGMELPDELAEELYTSRKEREERKAEQQRLETQKQTEERRQKEYTELLDFYKEMNGKDLDPATDNLPKEVWVAVEAGATPKAAYAEYLAKDFIRQKAIDQKNQENSASSPGSAAVGVAPQKSTYTREDLRGMSRDEIMKNWKAVTEANRKTLKE